jgi:uncharacterized protein
VRFARAFLEERLGEGASAVRPAGCDEPAATFVTLRWTSGDLQGCIGTLEPERSLVDDVAHNAWAAAMLDPRTQPVKPGELSELDVELSILSPLELLSFASEEEALAQIEPGVHGIVFRHGRRRATFLPSMWPRLPDRRAFIEALKAKAGLRADFFEEDVEIARYTVDKFEDLAPRTPSSPRRRR